MKQFLLLLGIIAVVLAALLFSFYILDLMKLADLMTDLRKLFEIAGIAAAASVLIMLLVRAAQKT